jgi:Holliday junction DNA helicase RuvA
MISHLSGKILHKDDSYLVLEVGGVGYKVFMTGNMLELLKEENAALWIYTSIRENSHDLYGFLIRSELEFFELLISVSGIGPKTALGILNAAPIDALRHAVQRGNVAHLVKIGGIGKKNAEKIVIELQEKLGEIENLSDDAMQAEEDAVEALSSLGYTTKDAREALKEVPENVSSASERVKQALKVLGKNK